MNQNGSEKLITASQLSRRLGGKPKSRTLLHWARREWIPSLKIGQRVIRFDFEAVKAKMDENAKPK